MDARSITMLACAAGLLALALVCLRTPSRVAARLPLSAFP